MKFALQKIGIQSVIPLKFLSRPLNSTLVSKVDEVFRNRWRTLLSVDDMVDEILQSLSDRNLLQKTVVIFTSDHGYHLGNYGLPLDKRMPYDTGKYLHDLMILECPHSAGFYFRSVLMCIKIRELLILTLPCFSLIVHRALITKLIKLLQKYGRTNIMFKW